MKQRLRLCVGVVAASGLLGGCAPAYHAYPDGCVAYGYRAQPAPPFTFFRGCETPWLRRYAARVESDALSPEAAADASSRRESPGARIRTLD